MARQTKSLSLLLFLCMISSTIGGRHILKLGPNGKECGGKKKLFVFGDNYVDTGNAWPNVGAWNEPFGMTFPGHPTGRFSDGRVLTDYIASFLGIDAPLSWYYRNGTDKSQWQNGMNFALGGSGVFDTWTTQNMSVRLGRFKELIDQNNFTSSDLESSIGLVHISPNDYAYYLSQNHSIEELGGYIPTVIEQLSADLQNLHDLGVPKIAVSLMAPTGCGPQYANSTSKYPKNCNQLGNNHAKRHNRMLKKAVKRLNNGAKQRPFVVIDLHTAFLSAMNQHAKTIDNPDYKNPTTACCKGTQPMACGRLDGNGKKLYTVCDHPELSFFWDDIDPTQHGWNLIYSALGKSLNKLLLRV